MDTADVVSFFFHNKKDVVVTRMNPSTIRYQMAEPNPFGRPVTFNLIDNNSLVDTDTGKSYSLSVKQSYQMRGLLLED
jgi:hypothetical protein